MGLPNMHTHSVHAIPLYMNNLLLSAGNCSNFTEAKWGPIGLEIRGPYSIVADRDWTVLKVMDAVLQQLFLELLIDTTRSFLH